MQTISLFLADDLGTFPCLKFMSINQGNLRPACFVSDKLRCLHIQEGHIKRAAKNRHELQTLKFGGIVWNKNISSGTWEMVEDFCSAKSPLPPGHGRIMLPKYAVYFQEIV
jgi:hypothetical protein